MHFNVLTIMGFTVIIAVIGHLLFDKTGIPESIFMIVLGLFLGPVSGLIELADIRGIITHVFTLSIVIILVESGLTTDIQEAIENMRTSTIFTVIVLITTSLLCGGFLNLVLGWSLHSSLILGIICSGTSTLPILYFTSRMRLNPAVTQMLVFESIINDVTIITAVSILIQAVNLRLSASATVMGIFRYLFVAVFLGGVFSSIWTLVLVRLKKELALKYLTTLAIAIILHAFTESRGGSGVIAVMIFAVTIGNLPKFFRTRLSIRRNVLRFFTDIEIMQDEVTFLVKNTFFFVLGLMFNLEAVNGGTLLVALALTGLMIISRWTSYKIIGLFDERYMENALIVSLMVSRGLTAGLTAFMPLELGLDLQSITDIVIFMILFTNLVATIGFMARRR
ncbi:cation:proton antiporter [archaeon]|nr:cation:proton antiporter [archaeon]